jgi:predicted MFS family arabinose efflux permease
MEWVSRITTVALEMVVPAVIGGWLDQRWGTKYLALVGVILGVTTGLWHLVWMAKKATPPKRPKDPTQSL